MGYKDICLTCRKAFNRGMDIETPVKIKCPDCNGKMVAVNQHFKAPKKANLKKWKVVSFLIRNGFNYNRLYIEISPKAFQYYGKYPENMREAELLVKEFDTNGVKKQKDF